MSDEPDDQPDDDADDGPGERSQTTGSQDDPPVLIVLRPIGTALPLGFFSLSLGMVLLGAQGVGWIPPSEQQTLGVLIAAYVFPLGLVASVLAFVARDGLGGATLGLLATSWLAIGLVSITTAPGSTSNASGLFQVAFGGVLLVVAAVSVRGKPLIAAVLVLAAARAALEGLYQLTDAASLTTAGGVVAFVLSAVAVYTGAALLIEHMWPKAVLPIFRRGQSAAAASGQVIPPSSSMSDQPGVRGEL